MASVVDSGHYSLWDRAGVITMPVTMDHIANDFIACHYVFVLLFVLSTKSSKIVTYAWIP
jgi:hypothetical protein